MATIDWARGQSGKWTTAANWVGDVPPGMSDTAVIAAVSSFGYTVTINSPVSVAGVVLNQTEATLLVSGSLASPAIDLRAGTLSLSGGTVSGTVTDTGASVVIGRGNGTLDGVSWQGALDVDRSRGVLTIANSLTLTGANGSGAGSAAFDSAVVFSNIGTLDNATLSGRSTETIAGTTNLTLGSHLAFNNANFLLTAGQSIVNDGTLTTASVNGGTLTNNGTIVGAAKYEGTGIHTQSFTNNGLILVRGVEDLNVQGLTAPGAGASIDLKSGVLNLVGTLTTDQLFALYTAQHVVASGNYGFAVTGNLDNTGKTLDIGTGTTLGTLSYSNVTGGTLIDHGGDVLNGSLSDLTYQSASGTVSSDATLTNVIVTGANTLNAGGDIIGGTLSGVGTVTNNSPDNSNLFLNGVDITGVGNSGQVLVEDTASNNGSGLSIEIGAAQSVAGYTIDIADQGSRLYLDGGSVLDNATVTFGGGASYYHELWSGVNNGQDITFGRNLVLDVAQGADLFAFDQGSSSTLHNMGTLNIAGTLSLGLNDEYYKLDNEGSITVSTGATLTNAFLSGDVFTNGGTIALTDGVLTLDGPIGNTGRISANFTTAAGTVTLNGDVTGTGTIALGGAGTLSLGGTVSAGQLVSLGHGSERLLFSNQAADTAFGGTIGGFAAGDSVEFAGKAVAHASFVGHSIVATLSTGGTIALTTTTALTGTLSVANAGGNAIVTYGAIASSMQDWLAAPRTEALAAPAWAATAGGHAGVLWPELAEGHGLFGHHAFLQA